MVCMGKHGFRCKCADTRWKTRNLRVDTKETVCLSSFDYPDICIGDTPSLYIYIMDGVGEGLQAKRRGLAVIIDHLTPPLTRTKLYGDLQELAGLVSSYEATPTGNP